MKKVIFYITVLIVFFGCKSENNMDNKPANFIKKDNFVVIVYDINILEGALENFNMNRFELNDTAMKLYKGVFDKHGISYATFKKNQDYYILTDQYKEITQTAADWAHSHLEKYKDIKPIKTMSFVQFTQLLELDDLKEFVANDSTLSYSKKMDSLIRFYRIHPENLDQITMDSLSFEVNIGKMKRTENPFKVEKSTFRIKKK